MRRLILVSLSMMLALFASPEQGNGQIIKVGAVVPLTGLYAALGGQIKTGYEIAVQHVNAAGGVPVAGKPCARRSCSGSVRRKRGPSSFLLWPFPRRWQDSPAALSPITT